MEMKKLMSSISQWLSGGEDVVLATIIASSGSTPRGAGSRMAIIRDKSFTGTIGGGALEYRVQQMALDALKEKKSGSKSFGLSPEGKENLGMVCGGDVTVYLQYISALDSQAVGLFRQGTELFAGNADSWLVTDITGNEEWRMGIYTQGSLTGNLIPQVIEEKGFFSSKPVQLEIAGRMYYSEPLTRAGKVFVFGGGHISQELVPLLSHLGFSCTVFDSIPEFSSKELFPQAESLITGDFENISPHVKITDKDYVVIMTRGHSFDYVVQAQALKLKPLYIGVIGSRKKIAHITAKLLADGFSREEIDRVHTPIGIAIKADTPAEIAVSITAELIKVRAEAVEAV